MSSWNCVLSWVEQEKKFYNLGAWSVSKPFAKVISNGTTSQRGHHVPPQYMYSKTYLKQPLKNRQNNGLKDKWQLNQGWKYCRMLLFCSTFDLHKAIIGLENQFLVFFFSGRLRQVLLYNQINQSGRSKRAHMRWNKANNPKGHIFIIIRRQVLQQTKSFIAQSFTQNRSPWQTKKPL